MTGILEKHSLFLVHVLQQKEVGKSRLWKRAYAWRPWSWDVLFFISQQEGWAEDSWISAFLCQSKDDEWWVNLSKILLTHWKAVSIWFLRIVQTVFLAGWTHSPGQASAVPTERATVSSVDALALQRTVRSILAWPAFCEGQKYK